jgi:N-acyl-D-aspartate/D-glutamate deacylase
VAPLIFAAVSVCSVSDFENASPAGLISSATRVSFGTSWRRASNCLPESSFADTGDAGHVPARARQACREPATDRVAGRRHDNRDGAGRILRRLRRRRQYGHDDVDPPLDELVGESRRAILAAIGRSPLDADVLALDVPVAAETLADLRLERFGQLRYGQDTDRGCPACLLRPARSG